MTRLRYGALVVAVLLGASVVEAQEAATPQARDAIGRGLRAATVRYVVANAGEGQDLNTLLVGFITDYRAGTIKLDATNQDVVLTRDAANILALKNGTTAQTFRIYGTTTGTKYMYLLHDGTNGVLGTSSGPLYFAPTANRWYMEAAGHFLAVTDNGPQIGATGANRPSKLFLASSAITSGSGTGVTVNNTGEVRELVHVVTVAYTNVTTNGTTHDLTVATLPAKTFITHILADVTTPFVCAQTCTTATLSATVGSAAGGAQYLASFDLDAAAAQFGDADAEFGASLAQATIPTPLGALGSWASTSPVSLRVTSAVGNLATLGVTNLNAGAVTFYITTTKMP